VNAGIDPLRWEAVTRLRLTLLAACLLPALLIPATASASCSADIVSLATRGSVSAWYSPGCYTHALKLVGPDERSYSDIPSLITLASRRDLLQRLRLTVAKRAPKSVVTIKFSLAVGAMRVSVFARKNGRFVLAALGTLQGPGGTLKARLGTATRIRVSAGYVGSGDTPVTVTTTIKR
jgi:hypothetical protein